MPRRPRAFVEGVPVHVVQRGNNRQRCFFSDRDRVRYLALLQQAAGRHGVAVHGYVLMGNHVHLLVTPSGTGALPRMMQAIGTAYVPAINRLHERTGTLWEGRYFACLVASDRHLLAACRYIDLNPVRSGLVRHPAQYRWSSYAALAGVRTNTWLQRHPCLELLGAPSAARYAAFCAELVDHDELARLRLATRQQIAFGAEAFVTAAERALGRSLRPRVNGRPRRAG